MCCSSRRPAFRGAVGGGDLPGKESIYFFFRGPGRWRDTDCRSVLAWKLSSLEVSVGLLLQKLLPTKSVLEHISKAKDMVVECRLSQSGSPGQTTMLTRCSSMIEVPTATQVGILKSISPSSRQHNHNSTSVDVKFSALLEHIFFHFFSWTGGALPEMKTYILF